MSLKTKAALAAALSILLILAFLLARQAASSGGNPTPSTLRHDFPDQFARIDYYAQNYSHIISTPPFPTPGSETIDRRLFHIPQILQFHLTDMTTHAGLQPDCWTRDPVIRKSFWFLKDRTDDSPHVKIGKGTTKSEKNVKIAVYESVIVESATGHKLKCVIIFDLDELHTMRNKNQQWPHQ